MTEFNWTELLNRAKAVSFEAVPIDKYHISVHQADAVMSSTGKPMIKLKLNIEEGVHKGRKLLTQLVLSTDNETALAMFFMHLKAFGIGPDFLAKCPPGSLAPIATALVGKHAIAKVGHQEWQGETRNSVNGYIAMGAGSAAGSLPGLGGAAPASASLPGLPGLPSEPVVTSPGSLLREPGNGGSDVLPGLPTADAEPPASGPETFKLAQSGDTAF